VTKTPRAQLTETPRADRCGQGYNRQADAGRRSTGRLLPAAGRQQAMVTLGAADGTDPLPTHVSSTGVLTSPALGPSVRLSVRRPSGEYLKLDVGENTLIAELKAMISTQLGVPGAPVKRPALPPPVLNGRTGVGRGGAQLRVSAVDLGVRCMHASAGCDRVARGGGLVCAVVAGSAAAGAQLPVPGAGRPPQRLRVWCVTLPPMRAARWLARGTRHEECPGSTDAACCCRRRATKSGLEDKSVLHLKQPRGTQNLLTNSIRN
jgi:hypothetical protein